MPTMANLMATERSGRFLQPPPLRWKNPRQFFSGVAGDDQVAAAVVDILARKNPLPENGRFLEAVVKAGSTMKDLKVAEHGSRLLATPLPRRRGAVDVGCDLAVVDKLSGTKRRPKKARAMETVVQAGPAMGDLMMEELDGVVLPPAPMPQLFSGGVVDAGYDNGAAVIDILAGKKPLLENGRILEAVVQAGPTIKDSMASERGSRLLETPLKRWKNPPPPMPQLFSGGAVDVGYDCAVLDNHSVTKRLPKRGRVMGAVLQPGPTMEDLMEEEHRGRVLAPPLLRWRNPPASKRKLFSGDGVDVGYDHAAAVIDILAAKNRLPANGRFLEAVVQAGPTMKDLTALERGDKLLPAPLPRSRNRPESMPQLFSGGCVDVGYDHATAVVNSLARKNPLPEKGRFLEAVLQAGPTMKQLTAVKHGSLLLPPPLPDRMNPPQLFSGSAVDIVDYDAAAALIDPRAAGKTLPTMKDMTVADGCLLPPPLPDWMNPPQLFSGNAVDVVDYDAAAALIDPRAAGKTLPTMKDMTVADGCLLPPPLPDRMNPPQLFSGNAVDVVDYDAAAALIDPRAAWKTLPTTKDMAVADGCLLLPPLPDWMNPPQLFSGNAVDVVDYDAAAALIDILAAGKTADDEGYDGGGARRLSSSAAASVVDSYSAATIASSSSCRLGSKRRVSVVISRLIN